MCSMHNSLTMLQLYEKVIISTVCFKMYVHFSFFSLFLPFATRFHKRTIDYCIVAFYFCDSVWSFLMKTDMFSLLVYICIVVWGAIDQLITPSMHNAWTQISSALFHDHAYFVHLNECVYVCCCVSVYARVVCVCCTARLRDFYQYNNIVANSLLFTLQQLPHFTRQRI